MNNERFLVNAGINLLYSRIGFLNGHGLLGYPTTVQEVTGDVRKAKFAHIMKHTAIAI